MKETTKTFLAGVAIVALCCVCLILGGEVGKQTERQRWERMDAESIGEIRAEAAMELYEAVDSCATNTCVETFSRMARTNVKAK